MTGVSQKKFSLKVINLQFPMPHCVQVQNIIQRFYGSKININKAMTNLYTITAFHNYWLTTTRASSRKSPKGGGAKIGFQNFLGGADAFSNFNAQ